MKFVESCKLGTGFCLSYESFSTIKNAVFKKAVFDYDVTLTYPEGAINRAKFDACMPRSFEESKRTEVHTELCFMYQTILTKIAGILL